MRITKINPNKNTKTEFIKVVNQYGVYRTPYEIDHKIIKKHTTVNKWDSSKTDWLKSYFYIDENNIILSYLHTYV